MDVDVGVSRDDLSDVRWEPVEDRVGDELQERRKRNAKNDANTRRRPAFTPRARSASAVMERTVVPHRVSPACRRSGITFPGPGGRAAGRRGEPASGAPVRGNSR
jgi:hypothetical protein